MMQGGKELFSTVTGHKSEEFLGECHGVPAQTFVLAQYHRHAKTILTDDRRKSM